VSLYRRPNTEFWWCKFYVNGQCYRQSTGETDRELAERAERRLRVEAETNAPAKRRGIGTLKDLAAADIDRTKVESTSPHWHKRVTGMWAELLFHFDAVDPLTIDSAAVFKYVTERKATGVRNQTIRRELQCLHRGLEDARKRKWIAEIPDPWPALKNDPPNAKLRGKLHRQEVLALVVAELPEAAVDGVRFAVITGLRCAELHRVRASWLAPPPAGANKDVAAVLKIPVGAAKNKKRGRDLGLNAEAVAILERRAKLYGDEVFPAYGYTQALKRTARRVAFCGSCRGVMLLRARRCPHCDELASVPRLPVGTVTLRDLRHTFASNALKKSGGNLSAVAGAMGHSELEITTLYLHAEETDVLNLASTAMDLGTEKQAQKKPGRKPRSQVLAEEKKLARDTGVEPVTYGFGGVQFAGFIGLSEARPSEKVQAWANEGKPVGHSLRHRPTEPNHGMVKVHCNSCGRVLEVEEAPNMFECVVCESKDVVVEL
jgi:integrase